ncbi:MAG: hypothetical protein ACREX3_05195 [Gammaproteobacteria bacterium]
MLRPPTLKPAHDRLEQEADRMATGSNGSSVSSIQRAHIRDPWRAGSLKHAMGSAMAEPSD